MDRNHDLTAVFVEAASEHLFSDDFELGSFLAWSGTATTTNGSATVESIIPRNGRFSAQYSVDTGTGVRRAYSYVNLSNYAELAVNTYLYFDEGLSLANGEILWLIQFADSNGTVLASYGVRADVSGNRWAVQYGSTAYGTASPPIPGPVEGRWYLLQAYYLHASTGPTIVLSVNGAPLVSLSQDTSVANNVASVRIGVDYYSGGSVARICFDDLLVDDHATPQSQFSISLRSVQDDAITKNLGSIILDGANYTLSGYSSKIAGSYALGFSAASSYMFNHWVATGSAVIANVYSQWTTITVYGSCSVQAFYLLASAHDQLFGDGFESGSFNRWTGITVTTGNSASVSPTLPHSEVYSGQFNIISGAGTRRAYCYTNIGSLTQLTASAYVYLDSTSLVNGQSMWLIQFIDSGGNPLSSFGMRADASGTKWAVQYASLAYVLAAPSVPAPSIGQWYLLRAYYVHTATGASIVLSVDGAIVASLSQDTSGANNVATIRFGICYYDASSAIAAYIDDVVVKR
jgi:hypothetical protein